MRNISLDLQASHKMLMLFEGATINAESVLDLIPGIFLIINESHEVVRANKAFLEILGINADQAFRLPLSKLFAEDSWRIFDGNMSQIVGPAAKETVIAFDVSLLFSKGDKRARPFHWVLTRLDIQNAGEGQIVSVFGQDMSEMKYVMDKSEALKNALEELGVVVENLRQAQDELVRSEKLAALGSMVAGISHELNTPIGNSLMMASHLIKTGKSMGEALKSGLRRSMLDEFLADNGAAGEVLVRNLTTAAELVSSFKQLAADQTTEQRQNFKLSESVAEVLTMLGASLRKAGCRVEQRIPDEIVLNSFPSAVGQVLTHLINNALQHAFVGRESGVIRIDAMPSDPRQEVRVPGQEGVVITLSDNGKGIPVDVLPLIFDPFFTTNRGAGRSGLGLNIAHNIVSGVLGGRISAESTLGFGTTFTMVIAVVAPARK